MSLAETFASIGITRDYSELDLDLPVDLQGWGSQHPLFERVIADFRPKIVIEVGTWKGASVVTMARAAQKHDVPTEFICVDTWLGSFDAWCIEKYRKSLLLRGGYPSMFRQFIRNIQHEDISDRVFPLPTSSTSAFAILQKLGVRADAVYVDGGHDFDDVSADIKHFAQLLKPGGVLFGDDYHPGWPGVIEAVDGYVASNALELHVEDEKFWFTLPRSP